MARYDAADERFGHQIPEPFRNTVLHHNDWRESLFFIMHPTDQLGDVCILTLANFPSRNEMVRSSWVAGAPRRFLRVILVMLTVTKTTGMSAQCISK